MEASTAAFERQKLMRHENLLWLIVAQGVVILPLLIRLPVWLWLLWLGSLIWRLQIHAGKLNFPSSTVKIILSGLCLFGLFSSYRGAYGVEAMVGFLVFTFILKLLELRSRKDGLLMLFIGFIALAAQFLFAQSIWTALYACFSCIALLAAWQTIYLTRQFSARAKLQSGATLLLHALPLMLVMFVIMPRLGPLWRTPLLQSEAHTGFSDSMAPGDIGDLVRSKGTAFRVNFLDSKTPPTSEMYWRGLILDSFDGRTWRLNKQWGRGSTALPDNLPSDNILRYEIIVEPHYYHWLFALAEPVKVNSGTRRTNITPDGLVTTRDPLTSRLQYNVHSIDPAFLKRPVLSAEQRQHLISLPEGYNPQTIKLAQSWLEDGSSPAAIVKKALSWYRQDFYYTLQPPLLGENSVDDFLFTSKRGFCEHFASSFAVLMRAAKVPTRVVVGYQGGTYNELENYWMIRQADAHAWAEVWLEGIGWLRVDPTSVVAPQRVAQGIDNALVDAERNMVAAGLFDAPQWLTGLRHRLDAANYMWSRWVLSYNADKQNQLLKQLFGGADPWRIGLASIASLLFLLVIYTLVVIRPKWQTRSPLQRALIKFDKTCLQWRLHREPDESIAKFALRLAEKQPQLNSSCQQLAQISQRALYADDSQCQKALNRALVEFPETPER
ncbi:transglutaminaseTgpA domain-containing protein [Psychromonas sp.]|uniref:transglutaminase family protein n=1 Tax=Psychromonas sp. TaxID=1884585 RepID=UPI0035626DBB